MKLASLIPLLVGVAILAIGIYLVSSHGYLGGTYLPGLLGIQPCSSGSALNGTGCAGFSPYGGIGVGTIVCLFGLGLIAATLRRTMSMAGMGGMGGPTMPPELTSLMATAQSRMATMPPAQTPGVRPGTVYCSRCGAANPAEAKFCHQCASAMPATGGSGPAQHAATPPPGSTG